jgi:ferredoxin-type protein NapH
MRLLINLYKKYAYLILLLFLVSGLFNSSLAIFALTCMIGPIILSLFKGRIWCGYLCPRGNFFDNIVSEFCNNKRVPWILRNIFFRALITMGLLYYFVSEIVEHWGSSKVVGMVFYKMIALTTVIGLLLSMVFNERTWCHFCPMGSISAFVSLFNNHRYCLKVSTSCVNCKICAAVCPLSIKPYKYKGRVLTHPDCIKCNNCAYACPKKAIMPSRRL